MKEFIHHLFIPRESNNHRAKILHHKSVLFLISFFIIAQVTFQIVKTTYPSVLGVTADVSVQQLLLLTNQKRQEQNLSPVVINDQLSQAALLKANDMFSKNYWAHNAPDGTTPWFYFKEAGYTYAFAGENLARGFTTPEGVIDAWMASPSHRENMLSNHYRDIGFAVVKGKLLGEETILIVELLGSKSTEMVAQVNQGITSSPAASVKTKSAETPKFVASSQFVKSETSSSGIVRNSPFININTLSKSISLAILVMFISVLLLDVIVIERKKIVRLVGHNIDHALFLGGILLFVLFLFRGVIL